MSRHSSVADSPRRYCSNGFDAARVLTTRSAAGYICTATHPRLDGLTLTFAPAPADEPIRLFEAVSVEKFWHPMGWDFAFFHKAFCFFSLPLPPGTVTVEATFAEEEYAEEQAFLSDHAAQGRQLVAVRGRTYYLAPAEPAALTYTVTEGRFIGPAAHPLLPPATAPDEHDRYFITVSDSGRSYFATASSPIPVRDGIPPDYAAFTAATEENSRHTRRIMRSLTVFFVIAALLVCLIIALFAQTTLPIVSFVAGGIAAFFLLMDEIVIALTHREQNQLLAHIPSAADYPRVPPVKKIPAVPVAPPDTLGFRCGTLNRRRLLYGGLALFFAVIFVAGIVNLLLKGAESMIWEDIETLLAFLCTPVFAAILVKRFFDISRKLRTMREDPEGKDDNL